jgi:hypothetical protein
MAATALHLQVGHSYGISIEATFASAVQSSTRDPELVDDVLKVGGEAVVPGDHQDISLAKKFP